MGKQIRDQRKALFRGVRARWQPEVDEGELWRFGKLAKQVNGVPSANASVSVIN